MKKHLYGIIVTALFLVGLSVLLYPAISEYINEKHASKLIEDYSMKLADFSDSEFDELFAEADAYNRALHDNPAAFYEPALVKGYSEALDIVGNGIMGYVTIPKIGVELPVYHGVSDVVLQIGAGHLEGTSLPVGGSSTHAVLSGHRGLPSAKLFTDLNKLQIGDRFSVTVLNRVLTYEVDQIKIVRPTDTEDLLIRSGRDFCTLLTCTPYGINSHRMLVRGVRVESEKTEEHIGVFVPNEAFRIHTMIVAMVTSVPLLALMLVLLSVYDKRIRRQNSRRNKGGDSQE